MTITRRFAVATKEVTVEQFQAILAGDGIPKCTNKYVSFPQAKKNDLQGKERHT